MIRRFLKDRSGASALEYGLIVAVMSAALLGGATTASNSISNMFIQTKDFLANSLN
jgi:pilus assembly protein Flp/PilA